MSNTSMAAASRVRVAVAVATVALLSGCASLSADRGFRSVEATVSQRIGKDIAFVRTDAQRDTVQRRVTELLAEPLSVDSAVQVALLNNRGVQASFASPGIAEADLVQASRFPNPRFSMLRARRGDEFKIEQALTFNIFSLLTLPLAREIETRRFEQTKLDVAAGALSLAADTRRAYFMAVAAEETVRYTAQVRAAAEAGADVARQMARIGNLSKLSQAREQVFYAESVALQARAKQSAVASRERLARLLGVWGPQSAFRLPERLPDLPATVEERPDIEQLAMQQRLDLQAQRLQLEGLGRSLGLARTTRLINALEFGPARVLEGERGEPYKRGYEVTFEIPIFDFGSARVAKAEALYMQAVDVAAESAINARSEVRESYQSYRTAYDIARHHRDEIVPLRKRISEENLLRYNGMLASVFELLADARSQIASVNSAIDAVRDFWIAQSDLEMTLVGRVNGVVSGSATTAPLSTRAAGAH